MIETPITIFLPAITAPPELAGRPAAATPAGRRLGGRVGVRAPAPQVLGIREGEGDVGEAGVGVGAEPLDRSLQRSRGGGAEVGAELEVPNERVRLAELVAVDEGDDDALGAGARGAAGAVGVGLRNSRI